MSGIFAVRDAGGEGQPARMGKLDVEKDDRQLVQVYKMAEMGVMASSIFHEIRQPLFAIKGYVQMMLLEAHQRGGVDARLARMLELIEGLEGMIATFLDFSRSPAEHMIPLDVRDPIEGAFSLLRNRVKRARIDLRPELAGGLPLIRGNFSTLQQVMVNLLINSIDALEGREFDARHLWVRTQLASSGREIDIYVADNGTGVPPEHVGQIFDYFFTTKTAGKGTGLGLAISGEIARAHGGSLSLLTPSDPHPDWQPTPVTIFRLTLPVLTNSR